jgi:murein DD-endopeptidase MepM/ murein hydrolase activator NlpD
MFYSGQRYKSNELQARTRFGTIDIQRISPPNPLYWEEDETAGQADFQFDSITLAALALILVIAGSLIFNKSGATSGATAEPSANDGPVLETAQNGSGVNEGKSDDLTIPSPVDPSSIIYPYDDYWLTQGPHGFSYGHMAIDIAAGKGATIKSPIDGVVTANYVDQYGNTTLILENDNYKIIMLHGDYTVTSGQNVRQGQPVGTESNHGYTTDMQGRSCKNRDCGYHTHLNVFDKGQGTNVNPLEILR